MGMHEPEKRAAMSKLSLDNKWKLILSHESREQSEVRSSLLYKCLRQLCDINSSGEGDNKMTVN